MNIYLEFVYELSNVLLEKTTIARVI